MDIQPSRRLLLLGAHSSGTAQIVKDLTGSAPALNEDGSTSGLTHEWNIETAYYFAKVPIWMDEIADVDAWKTEFLRPEAQEVVEAVGAWVFCFRIGSNSEDFKRVAQALKAIQDVAEEHIGYAAEVVMLAVGVPENKGIVSTEGLSEADHSQWEDLCLEYGFEYIDYAGEGTNEFREKTGFGRLQEALEANEWAMTHAEDDELNLENLNIGPEDDIYGFARDEAEMTAELFGMKAALNGDDFEPEAEDFVPMNQQAGQVDDLDRLMGRLLAVKEQSADLPETQRKRMAAQAVRDLLKDSNG